ncbi:21135_t:CDS:2, partial [Gigaspora margarita]
FSGPSHEEISRSIKDVPVPSIVFYSNGANFNITNIQCINNTALSSCDDKILFDGINFSYFDENLFPDGIEFRIYINNSISSLNDNISNQYPSIILIDPETYKQVVDDSRILKFSNSEDKVLSIVLQNYYSLLPFQIHTVLLERIKFQDLDTSLEYGSAEDIYKKTSKHLINYFGYSSKMLFTGQLNNSIFLNGSNSSRLYATLQVQSMSSILTTYKEVNKVSSTTVLAFLSGLGGSTTFLLVIYKFCFGGHKPPGLLKPLLPC